MTRICCICGKDVGLKSVMIKNRNYVCYDCAKAAADEIRKYKELMDEGIITEAEFEAKKQQLLGI